MTTRPHCIVCGKQIGKEFNSIAFMPAGLNHRQNHDREGRHYYLDPEFRPATKEECARYTNHEVISIEMGHDGKVYSIKWWEGEYKDEFFCTQKCAVRQGYAAARAGHRWNWS